MSDLEELKNAIDKFSKDRDWDQFHQPENLAKSICIEASELLECFQWSGECTDVEHLKEELADVFNYCIQMAIAYDFDIKDIILKKMEKNALKYPIDKAKSSSKKYDKL